MNQQNERHDTPSETPSNTPSTSAASSGGRPTKSASTDSKALLLHAERSNKKHDQEHHQIEIIQIAMKLIEDIQREATDHVSEALEEARELLNEIMTPSLSSSNSASLTTPGDESSGQSPTAPPDESQKSQKSL